MAQLVQLPNFATAIRALDSSCFFSVVGADPTTEAEYNERVTFFTDVTGETTKAAPITWSAVKLKYDELVTAYNNQEYARLRRKAYPDWQEQLNYIYDNGIDKWKTDIVDPVKKKYPKP